jgi:hypothetical protein
MRGNDGVSISMLIAMRLQCHMNMYSHIIMHPKAGASCEPESKRPLTAIVIDKSVDSKLSSVISAAAHVAQAQKPRQRNTT